MKHEKKSFIFFDDILDLMVEMSPEEVKNLMLSIRAYRMGDTVPTFPDRYMQMALDKSINLIGSADERYKEKCERLRQNFKRKNEAPVQEQKQGDAQPQPSTPTQQPPKEEKKRTYRPFQPDFSFIPDPSMREVFRVWLEYKKARKESYRTQASVEACYTNLQKLSGGDAERARLIVSQSLANNWAGLFELKTNGTAINATTQYERRVASERQLGHALAQQSAAELAAGQPGADDEGPHVPIAL